MRQSVKQRITKETTVSVTLNLDGTGQYDIQTGVAFLDHMLEQLARHALFDLTIRATGDTHIDAHHTTEDVGIVMGMAFSEALGDGRGIRRYGHSLIPMDETLTEVALDLSRRPYLIWNVTFTRDKLGDMDTELFREWFQAFAFSGGITLHVNNRYGLNNHHIVESCYKGLAYALYHALEILPRRAGHLPSTKEHLGN